MQSDPRRVSALLRRIALALLFTALVVLCAQRALYELFWSFSWWDDEGCLMLSIADFQRGVPLYDGFFSQYGPFYFLATWLVLHVPGVELDHTSVRFAVAIVWLVSAGLLAGVVQLCTRNPWFAAVTFLAAVMHLS